MAKEIFNSLEEILDKYPEKELGKAKDFTNQHYNRLTFLKRVDKKTSNTGASWACRCDCGNYIVALASQIISNHTTSCGCYNKELVTEACKKIGKKSYFKDYTQIDNPFYTFIQPTDIMTNTGLLWVIKCKKCNKEYKEVPNQLVSNKRNRGNNPCECWKRISKGEIKIDTILNNNKINYQKEYKFLDCLSPKGNPMKFDYLIENKYVIEYDGEQHFNAQSFGDTKKDKEKKLEEYKIYDKIKNEYCLKNNIPIIRIPYTHYNNICIKDLKLETSKFIVKGENKE